MANNLLNIILLHGLRKLWSGIFQYSFILLDIIITQIAKFMGPTWGPPGSYRPQMGPMLAHEPCYQGKALDEEAFNTSEIKSYTYILLEMNHAADEKVIRYKWDWIRYIIIILTVGHAWLFRGRGGETHFLPIPINMWFFYAMNVILPAFYHGMIELKHELCCGGIQILTVLYCL